MRLPNTVIRSYSRAFRRVVLKRSGVYRFSLAAFGGWAWRHIPDWQLVVGFKVAFDPRIPPIDSLAALERVRAALEAWRDVDPNGFKRSSRVMRYILVRQIGKTYWYTAADICVLDFAKVMNKSSWETASTLVHEATHARLDRMYIRYTAELRERIEKVCVAQSLSFVRQIPVELYPNKYRLAASLAYYIDVGDRSLADRAQTH